MKQRFYLLLLNIVFFAGCVTQTKSVDYVKTVSSDLYPIEMSRDQYYEELGHAYSKNNQIQKAIDEFRLALLHNPRRISSRVALSDEYRKLQRYQLAANELTEALRFEPQNTQVLLKLGDLYLSAQIYTKSKEIFNQVLALQPADDQAKWLLFYLARLEKDDEKAERYLSGITPTENNKTKLLFEKALLAKRQNRHGEYASLIQLAYEINPHDKQICIEMAAQMTGRSDFDSARVILNQYMQAHDFDFDVSQSLVDAAVRSEQYDMALAELDKQKKSGYGNSDTDVRKAHIYFLMGDSKIAQTEYQRILESDSSLDQSLDQAQFYLAQIYIRQNEELLAEDSLNQITAGSSYYADAQAWLALKETQQGQTEKALRRLKKAYEERPDQLSLHRAYADLLIREKKYKMAVKILRSGVKFFPQDEDLYIQMAISYFQLGQENNFKKAIDQALTINPANADIYSSLAELWFLKKFNPKDIEIFTKKALELNSKNKNMKPLLAWALMAQDRSLGSVSLFEKFYEENPKQPFYAEALSKVYQSADILGKAENMTQQAQKLHNEKRLQSDLILNSQRRPASLSVLPD